jgi:hypothetical protein
MKDYQIYPMKVGEFLDMEKSLFSYQVDAEKNRVARHRLPDQGAGYADRGGYRARRRGAGTEIPPSDASARGNEAG